MINNVTSKVLNTTNNHKIKHFFGRLYQVLQRYYFFSNKLKN